MKRIGNFFRWVGVILLFVGFPLFLAWVAAYGSVERAKQYQDEMSHKEMPK